MDVQVSVRVVVEVDETEVPDLSVDAQRERDESDVDEGPRIECQSALAGQLGRLNARRARPARSGFPSRFAIPDWNVVFFLNLLHRVLGVDRAETLAWQRPAHPRRAQMGEMPLEASLPLLPSLCPVLSI